MNIMGIGPIELVVVLVIAYLVLGPERMTTTVRALGKLARDLKDQTSGFPKTKDQLLQPTLDKDDEAGEQSPGVARPKKYCSAQVTRNEQPNSSANESKSKE